MLLSLTQLLSTSKVFSDNLTMTHHLEDYIKLLTN